MDGTFNSSFKTGVQLSVPTGSLSISATLCKDELGDGPYPNLPYAKGPNAALFVQGNQASLEHGMVQGPGQ